MNWRNKIQIKKHFNDDDESMKKIVELCNILIPQLKTILKKETNDNSKNRLCEDDLYEVGNELEGIIENFRFIINLSLPEYREDWHEYDFDGNFCKLFNEYLEELYNLGDTKVCTDNNIIQKFMWIG